MPVRVMHKTNNKLVYFLNLLMLFCLFFFTIPERPQDDIVSLKAYNDRFMSECDHREKICIIKENRGGLILQFINTYYILASRKYLVIIDGICASGCTYLVNAMHLNDPKSVCLTQKAHFKVHASYSGDKTIILPYVGKMQKLVDEKGGMTTPQNIIDIKYDDLKRVYRSC